ncbi:hypothetical protein BV22DRAFT_1025884, partial [Leucogyrophana mollusca]
MNISIPDQTISPDFPPKPPSWSLRSKIIRGFCDDTSADVINEDGCTVCGTL